MFFFIWYVLVIWSVNVFLSVEKLVPRKKTYEKNFPGHIIMLKFNAKLLSKSMLYTIISIPDVCLSSPH